ncbi:MAG: GDSL-type esterase/lipase family protein [bacterium]
MSDTHLATPPRIGRVRALAFTLAIAAAFWVAVEAVLWLVLPMPTDVRLSYAQSLPGVKPEIVYTANRYGMRSLSDWTAPKKRDTIRILCLGASTTNQPTQSTPDIWSAILARSLQTEFAGTGARIEVAAYGGGGQRVFHRVAWCEENLARFQPDIVVTLEGINDLCFHGGAGYVYEGAASRVASLRPARPPAASAKRLLQAYSQVYKRLAALKRVLGTKRALQSGGQFEWHSKNLPELRANYAAAPYADSLSRDPDPIREFSDGMTSLLALVAEHGARAIVLAQPTLWNETLSDAERAALWIYVETPAGRVRPSPAWLAREMARYNDAQRACAAAASARFVALDAALPKTLEIFFDDCHFTDAGNVAVAGAILPAVAECVREIRLSAAAGDPTRP